MQDTDQQLDHEQIWLDFYIRQANRAAMDLRWINRRLSWDSLEKLRETKLWIDGALEVAEAHETEAERGRLDNETS